VIFKIFIRRTVKANSFPLSSWIRCRPRLVLTSLLLAHLTPIFLLSLLLLWHTKTSTNIRSSDWEWDENRIDWAIRSIVGGLSSGVALGGQCGLDLDGLCTSPVLTYQTLILSSPSLGSGAPSSKEQRGRSDRRRHPSLGLVSADTSELLASHPVSQRRGSPAVTNWRGSCSAVLLLICPRSAHTHTHTHERRKIESLGSLSAAWIG
jgi:hypothetical protein